MGRSPCCEKVGLKKGPWTPEEDQKLLAYIEENGHGSWRALPTKAGLQRCGKSCRLRWTNYLRPDIKRGKFSLQEEQTIIQLHALLGNRWSAIATHLPKRTDNEIKNYWNTHLKKRLTKMGIDPVTHKQKSDTLSSADGHTKCVANLSHMAQWESARLEAEARLVRESKLRAPTAPAPFQSHLPPLFHNKLATEAAATSPQCLDVIQAWRGGLWSKSNSGNQGGQIDLESPTSTLSFSENIMPITTSIHGLANDDTGKEVEWKCFGKPMQQMLDTKGRMDGLPSFSMDATNFSGEAGFTEMLVDNSDDQKSSDSDNGEGGSCVEEDGEGSNNYWTSILDLVNSSSPSNSPPTVF